MAGRKTSTEKKAAPNKSLAESRLRMKAIRTRSRTSPAEGIDDRLKEIADIATGKVNPSDFRRKTLSTKEIAERLDPNSEVNQAKAKARKESGGHDRKQPDSDQNREG